MSHGTDGKQQVAYRNAWRATTQMLREGKSFSGRERNCAFLNCEAPTFANISAVTGLDFPDDGRALAVVDWDQDGDLDLWFANRTGPRLRLMKNGWNDGSSDNANYIAIRLVGTVSNRDAIGARVELQTANGSSPKPLVRTLNAGDAFLSQSTKWLHFGLEDESASNYVALVRWPNGITERFESPLVPGSRYLLTEGKGTADQLATAERQVTLTAGATSMRNEPDSQRVYLSNRIPLPPIELPGLGNASNTRLDQGTRPKLLIFWASWCPNCQLELAQLAQDAVSFNDRIDIVAISLDGLDESHATGATEAGARLKALNWPFDAGLADDDLIQKLQIIEDLVLTVRKPLAIPLSYLIDADGQLTAIYRGPIDRSQLLRDVDAIDATPARRRDLAVPFAGRWLRPPRTLMLRSVAKKFRDNGFADDARHYLRLDTALLDQRRQRAQSEEERERLSQSYADAAVDLGLRHLSSNEVAVAADLFLAAAKAKPDHAEALTNLGVILAKSRHLKEAVPYLANAVKYDPNSVVARINLAGALSQLGRFEDAVAQYESALSLAPQTKRIHRALARNLLELGKVRLAVEQLELAIAEDAKDRSAALSLAWILATHPASENRDGERALMLSNRLVEQTGRRDPRMLNLLAAAHAETGNFTAAKEAMLDAITIVESRAPELAAQWQKRLSAIEREQPVRDPDGKYGL